jgi:hypothetical protein
VALRFSLASDFSGEFGQGRHPRRSDNERPPTCAAGHGVAWRLRIYGFQLCRLISVRRSVRPKRKRRPHHAPRCTSRGFAVTG